MLHLRACFQRIQSLFFTLCPLGAQFTQDLEVECGGPESRHVSFFPIGLVVYQVVLVHFLWDPRVTLSAPWSPWRQRSVFREELCDLSVPYSLLVASDLLGCSSPLDVYYFPKTAITHLRNLGGLINQKCILHSFWRPQVPNQGVGRVTHPLEVVGENPSVFLGSLAC